MMPSEEKPLQQQKPLAKRALPKQLYVTRVRMIGARMW